MRTGTCCPQRDSTAGNPACDRVSCVSLSSCATCAMDESFVDMLLEPWRSKGRSLLSGLLDESSFLQWDDLTVIVGDVEHIKMPVMTLSAYPYATGQGFIFDEETMTLDVIIQDLSQRAIPLPIGSRIICAGHAKIDFEQNRVDFCDDDTVLLHYPDVDPHLPWNCTHLFAGAFGGWSMAAHALQKIGIGLHFADELYVDSSEDVMKLWSFKHGKAFHLPPFRPLTKCALDQHTGLLADVSDFRIMHHFCGQYNHAMTMSPPCISWSKGGLMKGLNCQEGWDFVNAIGLAAIAQPVIILLECADELRNHKHGCFVFHLLKTLGFRNVWDQVVESHQLTAAFRTRWLSVWARANVESKAFPPIFKLMTKLRVPWNHAMYDFCFPSTIRNQIRLTPSEKVTYGDQWLLPPAKRVKLNGRCSVDDVLNARIPSPHEPLPTLCASYSAQHLLAKEHLQHRGIYAALIDSDEGWQFLDPFRWAALLGATEKVILDVKIAAAFKTLGNAISIPHAALAWLIAFVAVTDLDINIQEQIQQIWDMRLTVDTAIVVIDDEYMVLIPTIDFAQNLKIGRHLKHPTGSCSVCIIPQCDASLLAQVPPTWNANRLLVDLEIIPPHLQKVVAYNCTHVNAEKTWTLLKMKSIASSWTVNIGSTVILNLQFNDDDPNAIVSPTLDFELKDPHHEPPTKPASHCNLTFPSFDALVMQPIYMNVLKLLEEQSTLPDSARKHCVHIALPDIQTVAQICIPLDCKQSLTENICNAMSPGSTPDFIGKPAVALQSSPDMHLMLVSFASPPDHIPVIVEQIPSGFIVPCWFPRLITPVCTLDAGPFGLALKWHNSCVPSTEYNIQLKPGDVLTFESVYNDATIAAGGHHSLTHPPTLQVGASFTQRCEFATNTDGWLATDELEHGMQELQWSKPDSVLFQGPALWSTQETSFKRGNLFDIKPPNKPHVIMPVLVDTHWSVIEIARQQDAITIRLIGFAPSMVSRVKTIIACLLEPPLAAITFVEVPFPTITHMCGWQHLFNWYVKCRMKDSIPDCSSAYLTLPKECQDMIDDVMQDSIHAWTTTAAPTALVQFASNFRKNFLVNLARGGVQHPVVTTPLHSRAPPPEAMPNMTFSAAANSSVDQQIVHRLRQYNEQPGWLGSDELDSCLNLVRPCVSTTYFPPPHLKP